MPIRFIVEHEAIVTRRSWNGWRLCLQWGSLTDKDGKVEQRGYRNIWRNSKNKLFTGRAQARLPSKAISDELWRIAEAEGWANLIDDELKKDLDFGPVTVVWHTGRPLGHSDRGEPAPQSQLKEFSSNEAALTYVCNRMDESKANPETSTSQEPFVEPFIMANGDIVWNKAELEREYKRRRSATSTPDK